MPAHKKVWMGMKAVDVANGPGDRLGVGSDYHCVHEAADVHFRVVDWRPFRYFSALERDPLGSGLSYHETWEAEPRDGGLVVSFSVAQPIDAEGATVPLSDPRVAAIVELYETYGMPMLEGLRAYLAESQNPL